MVSTDHQVADECHSNRPPSASHKELLSPSPETLYTIFRNKLLALTDVIKANWHLGLTCFGGAPTHYRIVGDYPFGREDVKFSRELTRKDPYQVCAQAEMD